MRRSLDSSRFDLIFFWPKPLAGLSEEFARLQEQLIPRRGDLGGHAQEARGVRFTWEEMQAEGLRGDLVDNKVASITATDYGTRFVIRKERRSG